MIPLVIICEIPIETHRYYSLSLERFYSQLKTNMWNNRNFTSQHQASTDGSSNTSAVFGKDVLVEKHLVIYVFPKPSP